VSKPCSWLRVCVVFVCLSADHDEEDCDPKNEDIGREEAKAKSANPHGHFVRQASISIWHSVIFLHSREGLMIRSSRLTWNLNDVRKRQTVQWIPNSLVCVGLWRWHEKCLKKEGARDFRMRCSVRALENGRYQKPRCRKSNRQRPERLGSQGGLSEPDAKWLYQTLKGVGGWDRNNERRVLTPGM